MESLKDHRNDNKKKAETQEQPEEEKKNLLLCAMAGDINNGVVLIKK